MTSKELQETVEKEVGFTIALAAFGKGVICDLDGNVLRMATVADIKKWNTTRNRIIGEVTKARKTS